jgi:hypothetical protein
MNGPVGREEGQSSESMLNNYQTFGRIPQREEGQSWGSMNNSNNSQIPDIQNYSNNSSVFINNVDIDKQNRDLEMEFEEFKAIRFMRIKRIVEELKEMTVEKMRKETLKVAKEETITNKSIFECIDYMATIRMEHMTNSNNSATELLTRFRKIVVEDFTKYNKFRALKNLVDTPPQFNLPPISPNININLSGGALINSSNNTIRGINNFNNIEESNVFQKFHLTEENVDNLVRINPLLLTEDDYVYKEIKEDEDSNSNIIKDYFLPDMKLEDFKNIFYGLYIQRPILIKNQYVRAYINEIYLTNKDFPLFFFVNLPNINGEEYGYFHLVHYNKYGDNDEDLEEKDEDYLYLINKEVVNKFTICKPVNVVLDIDYIEHDLYNINTKNFYDIEELRELNNNILDNEEDRKYNFQIHRNNNSTNDLIEKICNKYVYGKIDELSGPVKKIYGYYNVTNNVYDDTMFYILKISPKDDDDFSDDNYWCLFYYKKNMSIFFPIYIIHKLYNEYDKRIPLVGLISNVINIGIDLLTISEEEQEELDIYDIERILIDLGKDRDKLSNNLYLKIDYNIQITNNFPYLERLELLENTIDDINNLICSDDKNTGSISYEGDIQIITDPINQPDGELFKNTLNNIRINGKFTYLFLEIETYLSLCNMDFLLMSNDGIKTKIITSYKGFWIYAEIKLSVLGTDTEEVLDFYIKITDVFEDTIYFCPLNSNYEKHNLVDGEWVKYNNGEEQTINVKFIKSINIPNIPSVSVPRKALLFLTKDNVNPDLIEREDKIIREEDLTTPHYVKTYIDRTLNYLNMENYDDIKNSFNLDRYVLECINKPIGLIEFQGGAGLDYGGLRADYISFVSSSFKNTFFEEISIKENRDDYIFEKKSKLIVGSREKFRTKNKKKKKNLRTKKIKGGANGRLQRLIEESKKEREETMRKKISQNKQEKENTNSNKYSAGLDYSKISITNINVLLKRNKDNKLSQNKNKTKKDGKTKQEENLKYMYMIGGLTLAKLLAVDNGEFMKKNIIMDIPFSSYLGNRLTNEYLSNWIDIYAIFKSDTEDKDISRLKWIIEEKYDDNNSDFYSLIDLETINPEYLQFFFTEKELKKKVSDLVLPQQYNLAYTFLNLLDKYERYLHKENYFFTKGFKAFFGKSVNEKLLFTDEYTKSLITEGDFIKATYLGIIDKDKLLSLIKYQTMHGITDEKKDEYTTIIIEIINELDNDQLKKLLFFWTGSATINNTSHTIQFMTNDYNVIIKSHTCNNQLDLYIKKDDDIYYTKEELKQGIIASYEIIEHGFA